MDRIRILGGRRLNGTIPISGAKNATLPLMIASLLTDQTLTLDNVPRLADVALLQRILGNHGVDIMVGGKRAGETADDGQTLHISAASIVDTTAPYDLVSRMRASFWVLAPLVARMGQARVSLPGGCAIGTRPVDLLIMAMERLGAKIDIDAGYVVASAPRGLKGAEIVFPKVTVGGTHTAIMAASLANGTTVIENAAREPEIADVADCLNKMGARISGAGTERIIVEGVATLHGARHSVLPDRIETGTYAMAVAMAGGDILLQNARPELLQAALDVVQATGVTVTPTNQGIRIARNGAHLAPVEVTTAPFPAFPTDLQAQLMALMTRARGTSHIVETVFENRFMHVQELVRLGARINLEGERATIEGVDRLKGAPVMATDLRASVSLVIAALAAEGETSASDRRHGHADQPGHPHCAQRRASGAGRSHDGAVPGFPHRPAGAAHGADDAGARHLAHCRDRVREPLHARPGIGAARRAHQSRRRARHHRRRRPPQGRAGDGDRSARVGFARHRRARRRRRNHRQPRLPPRPRLRAAGAQARPLRRRHRAAVGVDLTEGHGGKAGVWRTTVARSPNLCHPRLSTPLRVYSNVKCRVGLAFSLVTAIQRITGLPDGLLLA